MKSIPGMRRCLVVPFACGTAETLQETLALSIQRQNSNWNSKWRDDWDIEPVIWMGSKLTEVEASQRLKDLKSFFDTSEPVKLTVAGLATTKHPGEKGVKLNLLREFPFLGWPGSGDVSDLDLSAAFANETRGASS
jgi:hypothetical protein